MTLRYYTTQNPDGTSEFYAANGTTTVNLGIQGVTVELGGPDFTALNGEEYFIGFIESTTSLSDTVGLVFSSNGTAAGTISTNLTGLAGGGPVYPRNLYVLGNSILVSANSFTGDNSILSTSNGSANYTVLADGVAIGAAGITIVNGVAYFEGLNEGSGYDGLWTTDGTAAGTSQIPNGTALLDGPQSFTASTGATVLDGTGDDTVTAGAGGGVQVIGATATLSFMGNASANTVTGATGSETIFGGTGGGVYSGGSNGDNILISQGAAGSNTTLTGAGAGDQIFGSFAAGNDTLVAGSGRDTILGGAGATNIQAGGTASIIFTGTGSATVFGGTAAGDTIVGGSGSLLVGGTDGDAVFGGSGALAVTASTSGADSIVGGSGSLAVVGRGANMLVVGGTSADNTIATGNGASLIYAGSGSTTVTGGSGSMSIVVASGTGSFLEGSGKATYDLVNGDAGGTDLISNFKGGGVDKIDLYGYQPGTYSDVVTGGSSVLTLSDGTRLTLLGVTNLGGSIVG